MTQTFRHTRRTFLFTAAAAAGGVTILPYSARADDHGADTFETSTGPVAIIPVRYAPFVAQTPIGMIYVNPVGGAETYTGFDAPDPVLITNEHGDRYNQDTLGGVVGWGTQMITNPVVFAKLAKAMQAQASEVANGGAAVFKELSIDAIPVCNTTEARKTFHPLGRDNGDVLNFDGFRIYVSGDTEDVPEMRALDTLIWRSSE